jgi:RNase P/RNase MRP subunit p29
VNVIGERLTVLTSRDPGKSGRSGRVLLETANTLVLDEGGNTLQVEKAGAAFLIMGSGMVVTGSDMSGRLQDRVGRRKS